MVANFLTGEQDVVLHTENGMLGMGPEALGDEVDPDLVNAGKFPITELPGAVYFDHAVSFSMIRGGHIDVCVMGAFQVSQYGDLANWSTGEAGAIPAVGGAMDLAVGAKQTWIMMTLFTKDGDAKLVRECTYPLTGPHCVTRVYSDYGVFLIDREGVTVRDLYGITPDDLVRRLELPVRFA
jgi:3-oxoadipate CoA-transferase beta subunit